MHEGHQSASQRYNRNFTRKDGYSSRPVLGISSCSRINDGGLPIYGKHCASVKITPAYAGNYNTIAVVPEFSNDRGGISLPWPSRRCVRSIHLPEPNHRHRHRNALRNDRFPQQHSSLTDPHTDRLGVRFIGPWPKLTSTRSQVP